MARVRLSVTVSAERLHEARQLVDARDSQLVDRALSALIETVRTDREVAALEECPYEDDPELVWQAPPGPALAYDGEIPAEVLELAAERRRRKAS